MKRTKIWMGGKFVDIDKAKVSIFDRGFLYGDGVFETMRSYAGVVFKLDEHLNRLFAGLGVLRIKPPCSRNRMGGIVLRTLKVNRLKSAYIKVSVTRGEGRFGIHYKDALKPNLVVSAKEFEPYPDWMYMNGISAGIVGIRQNESSPVSGIKSLSFLPHILARFYAEEKGCDDAILLNTKGYVAESATSNIFLIKRGALVTPSAKSGILQGITRSVIMKIAGTLRFSVRERLVWRRELLNADEVFLTNSLAEVLPVVKIDSRRIGPGEPGELTKLLHISYQKEVIKATLNCG